MRTPPTDNPDSIAWAWFFIIMFFVDFVTMFAACFYFKKIKTPWFAKLWQNDMFRAMFGVGGIFAAYMCYMLAGSYIYGFRILHYMLGIENPPWR